MGPDLPFGPASPPHALRSAVPGGPAAGPDRPRTAWIALWTTWALRTPLTGDPWPPAARAETSSSSEVSQEQGSPFLCNNIHNSS